MEDEIESHVNQYEEIFSSENGPYSKRIEEFYTSDETRFIFDIDSMTLEDQRRLFDSPSIHLPAIEKALRNYMLQMYGSEKEFSIGLKNAPSHNAVPSDVRAGKVPIESLLFMEGIVIKVDPQVRSITIRDFFPEHSEKSSLKCYLPVDLSDKVKLGDRVLLCGIFKEKSESNSSKRKLFVDVNNISLVPHDKMRANLSEKEIEEIIDLSRSKQDLLDLLSESMFPSIYGNKNVKKSILLMLLGGVAKEDSRGTINVLLVGETATGKSQILENTKKVAYLAISINSSKINGSDLTAHVVTKKNHVMVLRPGLMVEADGGILCIDNFEVMKEKDKKFLENSMKKQYVNVGNQDYPTRCSVIVAVKPINGKYDSKKSSSENIGMTEMMLSQFDLVWVMMDAMDTALEIIHHMGALRLDNEDNDKGKIDQKLLRNFIEYAKSMKPVISDEIWEIIEERHGRLMSDTVTSCDIVPVTMRTPYTIARLSEAHAKLYLRDMVVKEDVKVACALVRQCLQQNMTSCQQ